MKSAFAKLLQKDPVQSSLIDFRAGGNMVPILTRASSQSTAGYQTMGLPGGNKPYPGGGNNLTTLGAVRLGDQDGNGPGSVILPGLIFNPPGNVERQYPERFQLNIANNVYQPDDDGKATLALLRRLGDQQFKATSEAPFEDYRAQQRLAKDLEEASRNAGLNDLGLSREIIRNLAATRRQQNEDDYLRKMLDAGATPEAARKEIEDVRNANAIQEAKKVDDREYQAKTLIQRLAMARGITPTVREPLNQSSAIDNPQPSQAMSQAMGRPGEGFGTSPLDTNRQFMTPDFYKKYLRRSNISQEAGDEQQAFNNLLTSGEIPATTSGYSMATLKGQERQMQVEMASEGLASRLETIRARANRLILPLPPNVIGKDVLNRLYESKGKVGSNRVLYSLETIADMKHPIQLLIALNLTTLLYPNGYSRLFSILNEFTWLVGEKPSETLENDLKMVVQRMNKDEPNIAIPFSGALFPLSKLKIATILQDVKNNTSGALESEVKAGNKELMAWLQVWEELIKKNITIPPNAPLMKAATKIQALVRGRQARRKLANGEDSDGGEGSASDEEGAPKVNSTGAPIIPGIGGGGGGAKKTETELRGLTVPQLKLEAKNRGLKGYSTKKYEELIAMLK